MCQQIQFTRKFFYSQIGSLTSLFDCLFAAPHPNSEQEAAVQAHEQAIQ